MKRLLVTILTILYMASATGTTVHIHYCMGKLIGASLVDKDEDGCNKCCSKKSVGKGCCKDEHKTIKVNDHQQAELTIDFPHEQIAIIPLPQYSFYTSAPYPTDVVVRANANAPPSLWRTCPIYIQVRNFRI